MQFIPVIRAEFSASLLQSSVSHDALEISLICWFAAQETFIVINVENSWANILVETKYIRYIFPEFFDE